ncbi:hypothetical protein EVAR_9716_1 [Eumeta japonica]|uniref:Uncharacterized protein n=1 Tax=Eumeta variegata TaxID=151549 RepID=A0A4C1YY88_EUMVA|nr:hypothetical protein EVAR_9716_1 [Eumeta japonica]
MDAHSSASAIQYFTGTSYIQYYQELPTIAKFIKDATKLFFDIAGSHPNALLRAVVAYEPPHPRHFIRRARNVLNDPPDGLTAAAESLMEVNETHD